MPRTLCILGLYLAKCLDFWQVTLTYKLVQGKGIPRDKIVPRQGARLWLSEHGHILTGFQFYKEWKDCQVETSIKEAFNEKIPDHTDFEILMSVHSALVTPTLAPGQKLDGILIHRIFKNKPLYVRPIDKIVNSTGLNVPWSLSGNVTKVQYRLVHVIL